MSSFRPQGALTALVTPMRNDTVDWTALADLVEWQIAAGIHGLVPVGTTGESATLSVEEHVEVIKKVVEVTKRRVPVIAGAGANATAEAILLTQESERVGADAVLHVTPYYNRPSQEGLAAHFRAIAKATKLPIVLYNVPSRTGCDLSNDTVEKLCDVPSIVAIKDATGDMRRGSELIARVGSRLSILSGDDFTTLPLLGLGGHGVISVVSNVAPRWMANMCSSAAAGQWNKARELHQKMFPLTTLLFAEPSPAPTKVILSQMGKMSPEVRLPLVGISSGLTEKLQTFYQTQKPE